MSANANLAIKRLRVWASWLPRAGADLRRSDPIADLLMVIGDAVDAAIDGHRHLYPQGVTGPGVVMSGSLAEASEAVPGAQMPDSPSAAAERRRRPGRTPPHPEPYDVLIQIQDALVDAGIIGTTPLTVIQGVRDMTRRLDTAEAGQRQYREAYSHQRQIAEHYRNALQGIADSLDGAVNMSNAARSALQAPEWDGKLR